jgi:hypothetical protein
VSNLIRLSLNTLDTRVRGGAIAQHARTLAWTPVKNFSISGVNFRSKLRFLMQNWDFCLKLRFWPGFINFLAPPLSRMLIISEKQRSIMTKNITKCYNITQFYSIVGLRRKNSQQIFLILTQNQLVPLVVHWPI